MRIGKCVAAVLAGQVSTSTLWLFATDAERVQICIALARIDELPDTLKHPADAWGALNEQQQRIALKLAPRALDTWLEEARTAAARDLRPRGLRPGSF